MDTIVPSNIPQKQCTGCKQLLPATTEFFDRQKKNKDGLRNRCKQCRKEERRQPEFREHARTYHKAYRDNHPELLEKRRTYPSLLKERQHAYYEEYYRQPKKRLQILTRVRAYSSNPETRERKRANDKFRASRPEIQEQARFRAISWYYDPKNHERVRAHRRNRRARQRAALGIHTAQDVQNQYKRQKGKCYWCSEKLVKYHVDHIIPLSRGGSNWPDNIVIACPTCNLKKGTKMPHEFFEGGRLL